jgi:predicted nucleic acid-binding protein
MNAVDTNVLIYVHDAREPAKQRTAASLISTLIDAILPWQVACEFLAASSKLAPIGYSRGQAFADLHDLMSSWTLVLPSLNVLTKVEDLLARFSLSTFDALLIAACQESGVTRLYTEDFGGYRQIDSLEIVNPFTP